MPDEIENRLSGLLGKNKDDSRIDDWFEMEDAGEDTVTFGPLAMEDAEELDLGPLTLPEDAPDDEAEQMAKALANLDSSASAEPSATAEAETEIAEEEFEDLFPELKEKSKSSDTTPGKKDSTAKAANVDDAVADLFESQEADASSEERSGVAGTSGTSGKAGGAGKLGAVGKSGTSGTAGAASENSDDSEASPKEPGKVLRVRGLGKNNDMEGTFPWRGWAIVIALIVIAVAIVNSPIFSLKTYEVEGNERISDEDILRDLDLAEGMNLFRYAVRHLDNKNTPQVDPRLSTVDVYFEWPSHVKIVVEESQTIGYIYFQGTYLCIDRKGQVANSTNAPDQDLPIIKGIQVGSFSIGESLSTSDAVRYDAVVTIGSTLRKYDLQGVVSEINVHNMDDIILVSDVLEARCGDMTDIGQKIAVLAELLTRRNMPKGILHIESLNNEIYIEPFNASK